MTTEPNRSLDLDLVRMAMVFAGLPEVAVEKWAPLPSKLAAASGDEPVLRIDGPIIGSDRGKVERLIYGEEIGITPQAVADFLAEADGEGVVFVINCPGGVVSACADIVSQMDMYPGKITARVVGQAASAGSVVAAACDEVEIGRMGSFMLHCPWSYVVGNPKRLRAAADHLDQLAADFVGVYAERMDRKKAQAWMDDGEDHWLSAEDAISEGLADRKLAKGADPKGSAGQPKGSADDDDKDSTGGGGPPKDDAGGDPPADDDSTGGGEPPKDDAGGDPPADNDSGGDEPPEGDDGPPVQDPEDKTDDPGASGSAGPPNTGHQSILLGLAQRHDPTGAGDPDNGTDIRPGA